MPCSAARLSPLLVAGLVWLAPPAHAASETLQYSFKPSAGDGSFPFGGLTNVDGVFYGTTTSGGANGRGTVFTMTPAGVERVIYSFKGGNDGSSPQGRLIQVGKLLFGTTQDGGASGAGTVFSVTQDGAEKVIYSFLGGSDGEFPLAGLTKADNLLFGTTNKGGPVNCGTVFSISTGGKKTILHSFAGAAHADGCQPTANFLDVGGVLWSTTYEGGNCEQEVGCGTVFKITPAGQESVVYAFYPSINYEDGAFPESGLVKVGGLLYGTTYAGGLAQKGTVFKITPKGVESILYLFQSQSSDGCYPSHGMVYVSGVLYGTTASCGGNGYGAAYSVTLKGAESSIYSFGAGDDGRSPASELVSLDGILYGATADGGLYGDGTVFGLTP